VPDNEEIFLRAAATDEAFRQALRHKDRGHLSRALDALGIVVDDKEAILDAIVKVEWSDVSILQDRLSKGRVTPLN
jgi:hypothetical protein